MQKVVGIDVSKETLAVCFSIADKLQHLEVSNNRAGFERLIKSCGTDQVYVMEATGAYYMQLACFFLLAGGSGCRH